MAVNTCLFVTSCMQAEPRSQEQSVRQQRPPALQQQGHVRLSGCGLYGLLLPLPRMWLAQVWSGVSLRPEVAVRAGGGGGRRDHPEQVCYLESSDFWGFKHAIKVSVFVLFPWTQRQSQADRLFKTVMFSVIFNNVSRYRSSFCWAI